MYPPFDSLFAKVTLTFVILLLSLILYFLYVYSYWWRKNIFFLRPTIPFGNFKNLLLGKQNNSEQCRDLYREIKARGHKFGGVYFIDTPILLATDPSLIQRILTTDFEYFSDRGLHFNPNNDPLLSHLFALQTEPWRILRNKLTPAFTSGKLKTMFEIIHLCSVGIVEVTEKQLGHPIEINDISTRYTVDTIGKCAFGIECDALNNPDEKFLHIAERVINPPVFNGIKFLMTLFCPTLIKLGNLTVMETAVTKFFLDVVQQNTEHRELNNIQRSDFFQLLVEMKKNDEKIDSDAKMKMTTKLMAAQAFVFFAAGFETSSMTVTLCLFELSQNLELQDKVRSEIKKVIMEHGGKITYDGLKEMVYLDKCVQETLRKYPPLGFLNRECTKKYKIPDTDVVLEKGTKIMISLLGIQSDPEYFPDPEKFDPDRFSEENRENITKYTNIPFGEGHRNCIGMRFGQVQTKVCLANMLANFEFTLNPMTKVPLTFVPQSFVISLKDGIFLDAKKI